MVNNLLIFVALVGVLAPSPDDGKTRKANKVNLEQEVGDISGYYICKGVENAGKTYSGVAVITKKGDVYIVQWVVGSASTFTGIGIRQGNSFSASWAMPGEKALIRGVNQYRIEPGPRLVGRWATLPGNGALQTETLTFLKAHEEEE